MFAARPIRAGRKEEMVALAHSTSARTRRLAAVLIAAILAFAFAAQTAQATASPLRYVALGDSYSAASGVLPPDPAAPPECMRSILNYPHVIAGDTGAQLTDVTCGAAETKDFFESQYWGVAPQLNAVKKDTQLVTTTIGGNDSGVFINTVLSCGRLGVLSLGQGSPCKDQYGSSFEDTIRTTTYPSLVRALRAVHAKAPRARVAILGYPWIMPPSVGCFDKMPIASGDVPYVHGIQATLNDAVRRAAAATNTTYVNLNAVSEGHDACQPIGVRWIEPVLQGTNAVIVHPNALGEQEMARQTMTVLRLR
jgi:lysophospholipase L1-like esterase